MIVVKGQSLDEWINDLPDDGTIKISKLNGRWTGLYCAETNQIFLHSDGVDKKCIHGKKEGKCDTLYCRRESIQ